jgi:sulfate adenylyltransferase subunit 2
MLIMVDDERMRLKPGETAEAKMVRFRTLGCYPLSGAIESAAQDIDGIVMEMFQVSSSERSGRLIDRDQAGSGETRDRDDTHLGGGRES